VVSHIRAAIDDRDITITVMKGGLEPSAITDVSGPQFALIKSVLEKVVPEVIVAPNLISGGTDSRYYSGLTRNIFRHVPVEIRTEDLEAFHGTNERVRVSSVLQAANFYRELLLAADRPLPARKPHRLQ
jgi:carboxypeptidase PM20D1